MSKLQINIKALSQETLKIKNISTRLSDMLAELRKENSALQENWETRTSERLYDNLSLFYQMLENIKQDNDNIVHFLEQTCRDYQTLDESISHNVDTNIAM